MFPLGFLWFSAVYPAQRTEPTTYEDAAAADETGVVAPDSPAPGPAEIESAEADNTVGDQSLEAHRETSEPYRV